MRRQAIFNSIVNRLQLRGIDLTALNSTATSGQRLVAQINDIESDLSDLEDVNTCDIRINYSGDVSR